MWIWAWFGDLEVRCSGLGTLVGREVWRCGGVKLVISDLGRRGERGGVEVCIESA